MAYFIGLLAILMVIGFYRLWVIIKDLRETLGILKMRFNNLRIYSYPEHRN